MSRQINPGIFGDDFSTPGGGGSSANSFEALTALDATVSPRQIEALEDRVEKQRFDNEQVSKTTHLRIEKVFQRTTMIEERINYIVKEVNERLSFVMNRLKEKSSSETKIESLIERHNQIVHSFELRLSQSQKLIENQSLQLSKQQALIDEARRQIEKLKRL